MINLKKQEMNKNRELSDLFFFTAESLMDHKFSTFIYLYLYVLFPKTNFIQFIVMFSSVWYMIFFFRKWLFRNNIMFSMQ